jgi:hypothetical protein
MTKTTRNWLRGLLSALFSGCAGVLGPIAVDPTDFNFQEPGKLMIVAGWFAAIGVINFLAKSPLPDDEDTTTTVSTTTLKLIEKTQDKTKEGE